MRCTNCDVFHSNYKCEKGMNKSEWISVKDRFPPEKKLGSIFLATIYSHYKQRKWVEPLHYIEGDWYEMFEEDELDPEYEVTHWMPLPEVPE